jgi:hypothetical protein
MLASDFRDLPSTIEEGVTKGSFICALRAIEEVRPGLRVGAGTARTLFLIKNNRIVNVNVTQ